MHAVVHYRQPDSLPAYVAVALLVPIILATVASSDHFLREFFRAFIVYHATMASSIILYRLLPYHPLAKYPGPVALRVSRLYALYIAYGGNQHIYYDLLHQRYGDIVRTGPNHLHIRHADAIPPVLGARGGWSRGPRKSFDLWFKSRSFWSDIYRIFQATKSTRTIMTQVPR
jgi:hypothetical protein